MKIKSLLNAEKTQEILDLVWTRFSKIIAIALVNALCYYFYVFVFIIFIWRS